MLLAHQLVARAGIEPSLTGLKASWTKAGRLTRSVTRVIWWAREGLNFLPSACLADALPMSYAPPLIKVYPETESNRRMLGVGQPLCR